MARQIPVRAFVTALFLIVTPLVAATPASGAATWPGGSSVSIVDGANVFMDNLSGLAYEPSGSSTPGVMWAVRNGPSTLFRLIWDGTKWTPDPANGWSNGKQLFYPDGVAVPDSEGVTLVGGDPNAVYVSTESDLNNLAVSRPGVLRYDVSSPAASLNATREWDLTADLPGLGPNAGTEAVGWVPDSVLVAKGFVDAATAAPYNPATYADHGSGLFFVGVEQDGRVIAYALNLATGAFTRVATIVSGFAGVMALEFEVETNLLWAVCDDLCGGQFATLDVAQSGANAGKFVVTNTYDRPAGMPNVNNEGFTIAPQTECVGGLKPVYWSEDAPVAHALRAGTLNCTPLSTPPGPDPTPPGPDPTPPGPDPTPTPDTKVDGSVTAKSPQQQKGRKIVVKATVGATEAVTAEATGKIKAGKDSYALKPLSKSVAAGASATLKLKPAKAKGADRIADALSDGKRVKAKLTVVLSDAAGNKASEPLSVKLAG